MLICGFMIHHRALDSSAAGYRYVHFASQLLFSIAIVNLAGILLFRVILAPIHFEPAPILRDTLLGLSYVVVALTLLSRHGVLILQPLTDAERLRVAEGLNVAPFRQGEVITRQGNEAHYLYIIVKGEAEVRIVAGEGQSRAVARLGKGQVFGEMGLMTGEPRTATVIALTDTVCYRLDKDTFKEALERRPEIAEAISHLLAKRKLELDELTHGLDTEAMRHRIGHTQEDLLQRIRRFFILG